MSHHSSVPFPPEDLKRAVHGDFEAFGGTGNFPEGKLNPDDEGEIVFGVAAHEGKVVLNFGPRAIAWMAATPQQADDLATSLREKAVEARGRPATLEGDTQSTLSADDPLMIAWAKFRASDSYTNSLRWITRNPSIYGEGAMWAAFEAGYREFRAKQAHLNDLYAALGVEWGSDPFPLIAKLKEGR